MKKISLLTLVFILACSLEARENPFAPTNAYEEEAARIIEMNEADENYAAEYQQEQSYVKEVYEKMNAPEPEPVVEKKMPASKPALTEEKVKKLIQKAQKETVAETKKIVTKVIKQEPQEVKQVVYVKPRLDVVHEKELLPFLKIEFDNDKIDILSKYKVNKKLTLPGQKKIILDFTAVENFYTKRTILESTNFKKITLGNHKKDKFFRVVVELAEMPENYEVTYEDEKVTIVKMYEM